MKKFFQKTVPLGLVLILAFVVVVETGLLIGAFIYYDTLAGFDPQTISFFSK